MVRDIKYLLSDDEEPQTDENTVYLWDNVKNTVENGKLYAEDGACDDDSYNDD